MTSSRFKFLADTDFFDHHRRLFVDDNLARDFESPAASQFQSQDSSSLLRPQEHNTSDLFKVYNSAKHSLLYRARMENLAWRLMYVNKQSQISLSASGMLENRTSSFPSSINPSDTIDPLLTADSFSILYPDQVASTQVQEHSGYSVCFGDSPIEEQRRSGIHSHNGSAQVQAPARTLHSNLSQSLRNPSLNTPPSPQATHQPFSFALEATAFEDPTYHFDILDKNEESFSNIPSHSATVRPESMSVSPDMSQGYFGDFMSDGAFGISVIPPRDIMRGSEGVGRTESLVSLSDYAGSFSSLRPSFSRNNTFTSLGPNAQVGFHGMSPSSFRPIGGDSPNPNHGGQLNRLNSQLGNHQFAAESHQKSLFMDLLPADPQDRQEMNASLFAASLPTSFASHMDKASVSSSPNPLATMTKPILSKGVQKRIKPARKKSFLGSASKGKQESLSADKTLQVSALACNNCQTKVTPLWRRDHVGNPLCNACGLFLKLHGINRPLSLKTNVIHKRQRGPRSAKLQPSPAGKDSNSGDDGDDLNPTNYRSPYKQNLPNRGPKSSEDSSPALPFLAHINGETINLHDSASEQSTLREPAHPDSRIGLVQSQSHLSNIFTDFRNFGETDTIMSSPFSTYNDGHNGMMSSKGHTPEPQGERENPNLANGNWDWLNMAS